MRLLALMLTCSFLGACSLLVSTGDLASSSPDAGARAEAGPAPSPTSDGAALSPSGDDGGLLGFCAQHAATFCADFSGSAPEEGWTRRDVANGALDLAMTGPSGPVLQTSITKGSGDRSARLHHDLPSVPSKVHLELDVLFAGASSAEVQELFKLELPTAHEEAAPGYTSSALQLQVKGTEVIVLDEVWDTAGASKSFPYASGTPIPLGTWTKIVFDAVLATSNGSIELKIDGVTVLAKDGIQTLSDKATGARLVVGTYAYNADGPIVNLFDNVLLETKP